MYRSLSLAALLTCAASAMQPCPTLAQAPPDQPVTRVQSPPAPPAQDQPQAGCQFFTAPVTVDGGGQQQAVGKTCQQPDGSLQVTLQAPGLPLQTYTMPPPQSVAPDQQQPQPQTTYAYPYPYPYPPAYAYAAPYYWSDPWAFGGFPFFAGGSIFFVRDRFFFRDRFGHMHAGFVPGDRFRGGGFHGGGFHGGGGGHR